MAAVQTTQKANSTGKASTFAGLNTVTTKYTDFDPTKVKVTQFEDKDFSPAQKLAGITYAASTGESLVQIQCCESQIFSGGIPNPHPKYYPTDDKRMYVVIPEDTRNPASVALFAKLDAFDAYMQTDEVKTKLFGKLTTAAQFAYQPIVRTPEVEEEVDEDGNPVPPPADAKGPKPRTIKVKIGVDFKTKKITTKVFVKGADGKRTPVPQEEINTIDDVKKYVRFMSNIMPIIVAQKVYQQKTKKDKNDTKKYGVTFKLHQVVCTPPVAGAGRNPDRDDFVDDDDTNTHQLSSVQIVAGPAGTGTVTVAMNGSLGQGLDDGVEEEEEEYEDVEVTPTPAPQPVVVAPVVVQAPPPVVVAPVAAAPKPRGKRAAAN